MSLERNERRTLDGLRTLRDRVRYFTGLSNGTIIRNSGHIRKIRHEEYGSDGLVATDIFLGKFPLVSLIQNPTAAHSGAKETFYLYAADQHANVDVVLCLKDRANGVSDFTISEGDLNLMQFPFFSTLRQVEFDNNQRIRIKQLFDIDL